MSTSPSKAVVSFIALPLMVALAPLPVGTANAAVSQSVKAPTRTVKQIQEDLLAVENQIRTTLNHPVTVVYDPAYHQQMASEFAPVVKQRLALLHELAAVSPQLAAKTRFAILKDDAELAYFDDTDAAKRITDRAASKDAADATDGQLGQLLVRWWKAKGKADEQVPVLDEVAAMIKTQPRNDDISDTLVVMIRTSPATVAIGQRANDMVCKSLKGPAAEAYVATPNKIDEPLIISGSATNGSTFSSDKWKGKVVLVDFWATWCPPCRDSLPALAKLYADYHDKGLEVVGISSDYDRATLAAFLKQHPEMTWPQMFTTIQPPALHPLATRYHIDGIPRVYLIDRAGLLRCENPGSQSEESWVKSLLDEAAPAVQPTKTAQH